MLLSRTRAELLFNARLAIFRMGHLQQALDEAEKRRLESHMGFRGQWEEHRRFQLAFLKSSGLQPDSRIVEFGCGPLTLGLPVIEFLAPNRYTGVDLRPEVLDLAWSQIGKSHLSAKNPRLLCSASFGAEELGEARFDFVWSFSVLYHLTDELVDTCFAQVSRRLDRNGRFYANINSEMPESTWLQFPFLRRDAAFYREVAQRHGLALTELGTLEALGFRLNAMEKRNLMIELRRSDSDH